MYPPLKFICQVGPDVAYRAKIADEDTVVVFNLHTHSLTLDTETYRGADRPSFILKAVIRQIAGRVWDYRLSSVSN